jgi:AraC-like DNA-binding protein
MIRFGPWSTLLAVFAAQMLVLAILLLGARKNRLAHRYLAGLMVVTAGLLVPFVLGYAGLYDAYPWLTSAPFAVPLALGPLLYGYVAALGDGRAISWRHFVAPVLQFLYQTGLFPFPVATKWWWDAAVHRPYLAPVLAAAVLLSMAGYAVAIWRVLGRYQRWLEARRRAPGPARRLRLVLLVLAPLVIARAGYDLFDALIRPVDYFDLFAYYVLLGLAGLLLGLEGWRGARLETPAMAEEADRDWSGRGAEWIARLRDEGWWRDPDLDLPTLARRLGTNTSHLSRALNAGHGGFAGVLARLRAEGVAGALVRNAETDLLTLALENGFGSKASFNRAFRERYGMAPSAYRRHVSCEKSSPLPTQ